MMSENTNHKVDGSVLNQALSVKPDQGPNFEDESGKPNLIWDSIVTLKAESDPHCHTPVMLCFTIPVLCKWNVV